MNTLTVRIAMLNADIPVPNVVSQRGTYGNQFHTLLTAAAKRIAPHMTIESSDFDVRLGEYPLSLSDFDIVLITGSASSSYDNLEWIHRLDDFVYEVYTSYPHIKLFGSCFGHQLICQSLLRPYGIVVERDPNGWELGVCEIKLTGAFRTALATTSSSSCLVRRARIQEKLRLQFVHADHVKVPPDHTLPSSWSLLGRTSHCAVQGVYEPGRVLTLQGHFEFDRFVNSETMKVFASAWDPALLQEILAVIDADDDSEVAAEMVLQFIAESGMAKGRATRAVMGGLLTPPLVD